MSTLAGRQIRSSFKDLLQISNSNQGVDASLRPVEDGEGTSSPLEISTSQVRINGDITVTGEAYGLGQLKWQGTYNASTEYNIDDMVQYDGSSYVCVALSYGNLPTNTGFWNLVAQGGTDGAAGADGSDGADGLQGSAGVGITSAFIDSDGNLQLTLTNGDFVDCGKVVGTDGTDGSDATFTLLNAGEDQLGGFVTKHNTAVGTSVESDLDVDSNGVATIKNGIITNSHLSTGFSFPNPDSQILSFLKPTICTNGFTNSAGVAGAFTFYHDADWMHPYFIGLAISPSNNNVYERYYWHRNSPKEAHYLRSYNVMYNPHGYHSPSAVKWDNGLPPQFVASQPPDNGNMINL